MEKIDNIVKHLTIVDIMDIIVPSLSLFRNATAIAAIKATIETIK